MHSLNVSVIDRTFDRKLFSFASYLVPKLYSNLFNSCTFNYFILIASHCFWIDNFNKTSAREIFKEYKSLTNSISCCGIGFSFLKSSINLNKNSFNYYSFVNIFSKSNFEKLLKDNKSFIYDIDYIQTSLCHTYSTYSIPLHPSKDIPGSFSHNFIPLTLLDFNPSKNQDICEIFKFISTKKSNSEYHNNIQIGKADTIFFTRHVRVCKN